jgi:HEAT repeat protein
MAIRALNRARDKGSVPAMVEALNDKSELVRLEAAKGLANIPDESAIIALIRRVQDAQETTDVRIAAADALRSFRKPEVAQALIGVLRDRNFGVAWQARQSLLLMTGKDFHYDRAAWLGYLSGTQKPFG